RSHYDIPVIFTTTIDVDERLARTKLNYPFGYIVKPIQGPDIRNIFEMALYIGQIEAKQKFSEKKLNENEKLFQEIFDQAEVGVAIIESETGRFRIINQKYCDIIGYSASDIMEKTFPDIAFPVNIEGIFDDLDQLVDNDSGQFSMEKRYIHKNGQVIWVEIVVSMLKASKDMTKLFLVIVHDITLRKETERALLESEEKHRLLVENAKEAIYVIQNGVLVYVNQMCEEITGSSTAELIGTPIADFAPIQDSQIVREHFGQLRMNTREYDNTIFRITTSKGEIRWIEVNAVGITWAGRPAMLNFAEDITKRKLAEEKLKQSNDKLEATLEAIPDLMLEVDIEGRILTYRTSEPGSFFTPPEALLGKTARELLPAETAEIILESLEKTAVLGSYRGAIISLDRPSGRHWFELSMAAKNRGQAESLHFIVLIREISKYKRAEAAILASENRFRSIFDNFPAAYQSLDEQGYIIDLNDPYCDLIGLEKNEIIGKQFGDFFTEDTKHLVMEKFLKLKKQGRIDNVEYDLTRAGGETVAVRLTGRGQVNPDTNEFIRTHCILHDITERKQVEKERDRLIADLRALNKEVLHRVKNNLQVLASLLNLQIRREQDPKVREAIRETQNRILSMALVHESIYRSKSLARVDLQVYLSGLFQALRSSFAFTTQRLNLKMEVEPGLTISPDQAVPCGLILNELITNAIKYAFPEGQKGEITVRAHEVDQDKLEFSVGDNGVGLPLEMNWQTTDSLGLSLVKLLAEGQLHGHMEVAVGEGTLIKIVFNHRLE
ncbi:MAG: PAS domain S-box protein, partial [Deltaproteobacteria bacterium]|nr:PAS domain S-box protein [Deltaproteobacteria bacterium]